MVETRKTVPINCLGDYEIRKYIKVLSGERWGDNVSVS